MFVNMRLLITPLLFIGAYAAGQQQVLHENQLSRANSNTNMPEFIDIGQLIMPATLSKQQPRPTARIEDVGAATSHAKPIAVASSTSGVSKQPASSPVNGLKPRRTVIENHIKKLTVFNGAETSAPLKRNVGHSSSTELRQGVLNRFGDDESAAVARVSLKASAAMWRGGAMAMASIGYFWL